LERSKTPESTPAGTRFHPRFTSSSPRLGSLKTAAFAPSKVAGLSGATVAVIVACDGWEEVARPEDAGLIGRTSLVIFASVWVDADAVDALEAEEAVGGVRARKDWDATIRSADGVVETIFGGGAAKRLACERVTALVCVTVAIGEAHSRWGAHTAVAEADGALVTVEVALAEREAYALVAKTVGIAWAVVVGGAERGGLTRAAATVADLVGAALAVVAALLARHAPERGAPLVFSAAGVGEADTGDVAHARVAAEMTRWAHVVILALWRIDAASIATGRAWALCVYSAGGCIDAGAIVAAPVRTTIGCYAAARPVGATARLAHGPGWAIGVTETYAAPYAMVRLAAVTWRTVQLRSALRRLGASSEGARLAEGAVDISLARRSDARKAGASHTRETAGAVGRCCATAGHGAPTIDAPSVRAEECATFVVGADEWWPTYAVEALAPANTGCGGTAHDGLAAAKVALRVVRTFAVCTAFVGCEASTGATLGPGWAI